MAKYYSVVLFRVKGLKVAAETVQIIERMVEKAENQELAINYYYYQMKDQWSMGLFS
jgi:hypothetical protein